MNYHRRPGRTLAHFCTFVLLMVACLAWKGVAVTFGSGCIAPQFGGNQLNVGVGTSPRSIAVGDFNHDGRNDLAVANYGTDIGSPNGGISVLLNNGAGGFSSPSNINGGINPRSIATADFNNDGHLDLTFLHYVNGSCCISGFASVLLGDGAGNFTPAGSPLSVGSDPRSLTVGDFNKDGKADLAATILNSNVAILLGNGLGGFGAATTFTANGNATSIATGDVNADGNPDLVTGNLNGFDISVLTGNGSGGFSAPVKFSAGGNPQFVALADVNQDSKLDVVTANSTNNVSVLLGNGAGSFGSPTLFTVPSSPQSVVAKDLNGDGRVDLAAAQNTTNNVSVLIGDGNGNFGSPTNYTGGGGAFFVASGEINGDGKIDLVVANISSNSVSILTGDGSGGFGGARTFNTGLSPSGVASGDFNGDGKLDLITPNNGQNSVSVLLGEGNGSFGADVKYPANFSPRRPVVGDYNGDGKLDVAVANGTCCDNKQSVSILLGNGSGGFGAPTSFTAGTNAMALVSADFNSDGKLDLAVANNADSNISILIGNGSGAFAAPVNFALSRTPSDIAGGDFNGDGNTDLVVAAGYVFVLLGNGSGSFAVGPPIDTPGAVGVTVGDVNGDGKADIATTDNNGVSVFLGDGSGGFGSPNSWAVTSPGQATFGDFNGDGKTDLAVANGSSFVTIWLGDGTGAFSSPISFNAGSSPRGVLAVDVNIDGRGDLVTGNSSSVSVLLNTCGEAPTARPSISINDVSLPEGQSGQTNASFTVTLSAPSAHTVTVNYYTINQSAAGGADYQSSFGHIVFAPGMTSQIISIPVLGDTSVEPNETFIVQLRDGLNGNILVGQGKATILNDDETPVPPHLILDESGPEINQAVALDSLLFLRDPFPVVNLSNALNQSSDKNTRVIVFVTNLQLAQGETSSSVVVNLVDGNNQSHDVTAEDVRLLPLFQFTQVRFRLPDTLAPGTCTIKVKAHGLTSNSGTMRIKN